MELRRRDFLKLGALGLGSAAGWLGHPPARAQERPNIVFIYTDDQAPWTIHALGHDNPSTPHLDRLFHESVICDNAFTTTPVCSPSRAGLLCSRYGIEVGITDWINPKSEPEIGLDPQTPSWVRLLRDAGYETGLVGKWHLGTQDRFHPSAFGYDHFAGFREGGTKVENPELEVDGEKRQMQGLTVDILTDLGMDFIRAAKGPFLLSLHHRSPHRPWLPAAPEDADPYEDRPLELADADYPELDVEEGNKSLKEYLSSVSGIDRNVGRILALLDELSLTQNTIVVFTSDHGYNIGQHGLIHKGNGFYLTRQATRSDREGKPLIRPNMFDTSLRVPLAVRWPGQLTPGHHVKECVTNLDWFPTLLAMAGLDLPENLGVRGRNMLPLLQGQQVPWENSFYGEYSIHNNALADMRMFRTPEWKLVRDFKTPGRDELYHVAEDPEERMNLLYAPEHWKTYQQLNEQLLAGMRSLNDPLLAQIS